jgi:2',3'-cyclic-nucleotide 2'-phosphodiesterase/3'-nucleotidase
VEFPGDLFDIIDGLSYRIDPSGPAKYKSDGTLLNPGAARIRDLRFGGKPLDEAGEFILVTHEGRVEANYPGANPGNVILECPVENRWVLQRYIIEKREISPRPDNNWSLILPQNAGPLLFRTSPEAQENPPPGLNYLRTDEDGFAVYQLNG